MDTSKGLIIAPALEIAPMEEEESTGRPKILPAIPPEWMEVMKALAEQPRTVMELQCLLNLAQSTVSNRLIDMRDAGLVTHSRMGHANLYRLVPDAIVRTAEDIKAQVALIESLVAKTKRARKKPKPQRIA